MEENSVMVLRTDENPKSEEEFNMTVLLKKELHQKLIDFASLFDIKLYEMESLTEPEAPLDLTLDLYQMEPDCG